MYERERERGQEAARAWAAVEEAAARIDRPPAGFTGRVLAAIRRERLSTRAKAPSATLTPAWVFSAAGAVIAAVIGGVLVWYATHNPDALTTLASAAEAERTFDFDHLVAFMGGLAGAAAALGAMAYYYLVPRR
jgi:hypothetical protein